MKKCLYCNKEIESKKICCDNNCEDSYNNFKNFVAKWKKLFCILILVSIIMVLVGSIFAIGKPIIGGSLLNLGIILMGVTIIIFPFATPETFKRLGVKKTLLIVRVMALALGIFALGASFL